MLQCTHGELYTLVHHNSHLNGKLLILLTALIFVQGGLVNNIERSVLEAQEYVERAKESIPKCKKFKKTSRRVRCNIHTVYKLTLMLLFLFFLFLSFLLSASPSLSFSTTHYSSPLPHLLPHLYPLIFLPPHLAPSFFFPSALFSTPPL